MEYIKKYFPGLSELQLKKFEMLGELYTSWNEKINVISRKDIGNLYLHHILHSLSLAKVLSLNSGAKILDVGTGGGFPGIPLAIFFPEAHFHLVDSIGKKIKVVDAIAREAGIANLSCEQIRAEQIKDKYDFVVSRAVTTLPEFASWVQGKFSKQHMHKIKNGIFYLKGGDLSEEIAPFKKIATVFDISDFFAEPFFETKKIVYLPMV